MAGIGRRLGKYELLGEIRRDGGGVLHRAVDPATGRRVTLLSVPLSRFAGRDAALERLRDDARAATRLVHPRIAAILASGEAGGSVYVALPPEEGPRLDQRLSGGVPLPWEEAHAILSALLDALTRAHRAGIVHGALDAGAVRLGGAGAVSVTGFGLAALSAPDATERDDLRAAAALAGRLLAGHGDRPGVKALLDRARSPEDGGGFADAGAFDGAVRALSAPQPVAAPSHGRARIAAALLIGLGVAGGGLWWQRDPLPTPAAVLEPVATGAPSPPAETAPAEETAAPGPVPPDQEPDKEPDTESDPVPEPAVAPPLPDPDPFPEAPPPDEQPAAPLVPPHTPSPTPPPLPPPSPPPEPAEPARPPIAAIRTALHPLPCALLAVEEVNGGVLVSGTVAGEAALPAVRETLERAAAGWEHGLDVAVARPGLCVPLTLLAPAFAANAALAAPLRVQLPGGTTLHGGDPLILDVTGPAAPTRIRVDYFTTDGNVVHLLPNPLEPDGRLDAGSVRRLGDREAGGRFWSAGAPFGTELVLALATPSPLFAAARPEIEPATVYLADLKRALAAAGAEGRALAAPLFITTAP